MRSALTVVLTTVALMFAGLGTSGAAAPAPADGVRAKGDCLYNVFRVNKKTGVYAYEQKEGKKVRMRGRFDTRKKGAIVRGVNVKRKPPHSWSDSRRGRRTPRVGAASG